MSDLNDVVKQLEQLNTKLQRIEFDLSAIKSSQIKTEDIKEGVFKAIERFGVLLLIAFIVGFIVMKVFN